MNCVHEELIAYQDGNLIGTCKLCGQVKQYDPLGHEKPIILKEGNVKDAESTEIPIATIVPTVMDNEADKVLPLAYGNMGKGAKHRFFEKNKQQILADTKELGQLATRKKWGIKPSTWCYLIKRWLPEHAPFNDVLINKAQLPHVVKIPSLPLKLPEWNEAWGDSVKIAWLECVKSLIVNSPLPISRG